MYLNKKLDDISIVTIRGKQYRKRIILADANIPYKLSIDRNTNNLFFCINADEFSDQSFHSAFMNLDTGAAAIVPGIRNGFASAVDSAGGDIYLGGSDGIYKFSYSLHDVNTPALLKGIDIFDMYYHKQLYFVETSSQNLFMYRFNGKKAIIRELDGSLIHHFIITPNDDLWFVSSMGMFVLPKGAKVPILCEAAPRDINYRGMCTDVTGQPYIIAQDGVYSIDKQSYRLDRILPVENGYGLAFDKDNNMVYSDERRVFMLTPW